MSLAPTPSTVELSTDVAIVGAGPVGLMIANYLGQCGVNVTLVEKLDSLIDYPRAMAWTMKACVLSSPSVWRTRCCRIPRPGTPCVPDPKGRCFADIQPKTDEFGWSRRNAFIQPLADRVLFDGLQRFNNVKVLFSRELSSFEQSDSAVVLNLTDQHGRSERLNARYLIGCDGGNSLVRRSLDISFEGKTAPNQWIVVDIANDPLARPTFICAATPCALTFPPPCPMACVVSSSW
jgi:3-(3-hydroxy-phenyl)propionate hydroxylase